MIWRTSGVVMEWRPGELTAALTLLFCDEVFSRFEEVIYGSTIADWFCRVSHGEDFEKPG
jgi:hypothetical protein